eukprot:g7361.t1
MAAGFDHPLLEIDNSRMVLTSNHMDFKAGGRGGDLSCYQAFRRCCQTRPGKGVRKLEEWKAIDAAAAKTRPEMRSSGGAEQLSHPKRSRGATSKDVPEDGTRVKLLAFRNPNEGSCLAMERPLAEDDDWGLPELDPVSGLLGKQDKADKMDEATNRLDFAGKGPKSKGSSNHIAREVLRVYELADKTGTQEPRLPTLPPDHLRCGAEPLILFSSRQLEGRENVVYASPGGRLNVAVAERAGGSAQLHQHDGIKTNEEDAPEAAAASQALQGAGKKCASPPACIFCLDGDDSKEPLLHYCLRCDRERCHSSCWLRHRSTDKGAESLVYGSYHDARCPTCRGYSPGLFREKFAHLVPKDADCGAMATLAMGGHTGADGHSHELKHFDAKLLGSREFNRVIPAVNSSSHKRLRRLLVDGKVLPEDLLLGAPTDPSARSGSSARGSSASSTLLVSEEAGIVVRQSRSRGEDDDSREGRESSRSRKKCGSQTLVPDDSMEMLLIAFRDRRKEKAIWELREANERAWREWREKMKSRARNAENNYAKSQTSLLQRGGRGVRTLATFAKKLASNWCVSPSSSYCCCCPKPQEDDHGCFCEPGYHLLNRSRPHARILCSVDGSRLCEARWLSAAVCLLCIGPPALNALNPCPPLMSTAVGCPIAASFFTSCGCAAPVMCCYARTCGCECYEQHCCNRETRLAETARRLVEVEIARQATAKNAAMYVNYEVCTPARLGDTLDGCAYAPCCCFPCVGMYCADAWETAVKEAWTV